MIFLKQRRVGGYRDRTRERGGRREIMVEPQAAKTEVFDDMMCQRTQVTIFLRKRWVGGYRERTREREEVGEGVREFMVESGAAKKEVFDVMMKAFYKVVVGDTSI